MQQQQVFILLVLGIVAFLSVMQCDTPGHQKSSHRRRRSTNICDSRASIVPSPDCRTLIDSHPQTMSEIS
jgi:hypothetical protein